MFRILASRSANVGRVINNVIPSKFNFITSSAKTLTSGMPILQKAEVEVTFCLANGEKKLVKGKEGDSLLDIVVNNNVDLDGFGACEGTLTCSTCHLIFSKDVFEKLPEKATDEELDMLDLAYELTETSRLGCQIIMTKELSGLEVRVPSTVNDLRNG